MSSSAQKAIAGNAEKRNKPDSSPNQPDQDNVIQVQDGQLEKLFDRLSDQLNKNIERVNENIRCLREEVSGEMAQLKLAIDGFKEENKQIVQRQSALEGRIEQLARAAKKNKVVITGLKRNGQPTIRTVNNFLSEQLHSTLKVIDAFEFKQRSGKTRIVAQFGTFEDKIAIMKEKKNMPKNIYFNNDLTTREQFLHFKAREFLKSMNTQGKIVKIRKDAVHVGDTTFIWDEQHQNFQRRP